MGFFSQDCHGCGHPALSFYATSLTNAWMNDVTVITPYGDLVQGGYDGYGRVFGNSESDTRDEDEPVIGGEATVWHTACWEVAGRPAEYKGPSPLSQDQGWFFDPEDHNVPDPRKAG